jgi:cytochrome c biogenesis protein CcmG/thiol:disulfide interchange protein DsbE
MVNHPAPDFTLTTFKGTTISLEDLRGKPVVINFWASWCPPCRIEAPLIERTWRAYKKRGPIFIGVNIQDRKEDALNYIREFDITYPNGPDPTGEIAIDYGVSGLPVTFFVSSRGEVVDGDANFTDQLDECFGRLAPFWVFFRGRDGVNS